MDSKRSALFFSLNILFFTMVAARGSSPSPSPNGGTCPIDAVKLGVCANVLNLVNVTIGSPAATQCCSLIDGLVDLEAAVCICTAIRANVLGIINLDVPVELSLILGACGKQTPPGFQCR